MSGVLKFCACAEKIPQLGNVFGAQGCLGTWNFLATSSVHGRSSVERQRQQQWNCGQSLRTYGCEARPRTFTNLASWNADGALQAKFFGLLSASRNEIRCRRWRNYSSGKTDPHKILKSPHPDVEIPDVSFTEAMFSSFKKQGNRTAIVDVKTGREVTFSQLMDTVARVAGSLHDLGYRKGDVIMAHLSNSPEYAIIFLACGMLGAVLTTANPAYTAEELARQMALSGCRAVITMQHFSHTVDKALASDPDLASKVKHRWVVGGSAPGYQEFSALDSGGAGRCPDVALDPQNDVLALPYSSGTTGLPKGVLLTHRNILANIAQLQTVLPLEAGQDRMLGVLPFYHIYGMVVVQFSSLFQGAALLTLPRFHPDDFLHAIEAHRSTVLPLVPPLVLFLAKEPAVESRDMSSVRTIISGAAPLSRNVTEEAMSRTKATIQQAYGLTELSPVSHFNTPPIKFGTIGPLVPSTLAKIVDVETGKALGSNMAGELCVKGPQVMKGYLNNQKATEEMVRDGWVHTGDVGFYDEDGYVTITDRIKELIKYKGYQVPPAELEAVVLSHPAVKDAAVIGIPDDVSGELPRAYVTLKPDCTVSMEEIANYVKERVAPYKQLRGGVYPVDEVPKTASGKILRRVLLARAKAGH